MNAVVKEGCIGCELCVQICDDVFRMNEEGIAESFTEVTPEFLEDAKEAADSCPVSVIHIE